MAELACRFCIAQPIDFNDHLDAYLPDRLFQKIKSRRSPVMIGCFIPMLTLAIGGSLGTLVGGREGGYWGGGVGFALGMLLIVAFFYVVANGRHR